MPGIKVVLFGTPRTKKNAPRIVGGPHPRLLPSEAYVEWLEHVLLEKLKLKRQLELMIPIKGPVWVKALVYRDRDVGDRTGYYDAIADAIQSDVWKCSDPHKVPKTRHGKPVFVKRKPVMQSRCGKKMTTDEAPAKCIHCGWPVPKRVRRGLGLIEDDKQIIHWDGTRLRLDKLRPRVEIEIRMLDEQQIGLGF